MTLKHIHGGNIRQAADKYGIAKNKILDFSANINPLGPSPKAIEAIINNLDQIINYPDPECLELRQSLGEFIKVEPENILMGNGAAELIYLLVKLLKPRRVLIAVPTFGEYELAVVTNGGVVEDFNLAREDGFALDADKLIKALPGVDMVIICNPNNPTGKLVSREALLKILEAAERLGTFVLIDEAFIDFVREPLKYSVLDKAAQSRNLAVLYSLTKFFALPGLRLGSLVANKELVEQLAAIKDPWNVNTLAQVAGVASFEDTEYIAQTKANIWLEMDFLFQALQNVKGLKPFKPAANYIFIDIRETGFTSPELTDILAKQGILIRDCSSYKNLEPYYIRIAVKNRADNEVLIHTLQAAIERGQKF